MHAVGGMVENANMNVSETGVMTASMALFGSARDTVPAESRMLARKSPSVHHHSLGNICCSCRRTKSSGG